MLNQNYKVPSWGMTQLWQVLQNVRATAIHIHIAVVLSSTDFTTQAGLIWSWQSPSYSIFFNMLVIQNKQIMDIGCFENCFTIQCTVAVRWANIYLCIRIEANIKTQHVRGETPFSKFALKRVQIGRSCREHLPQSLH